MSPPREPLRNGVVPSPPPPPPAWGVALSVVLRVSQHVFSKLTHVLFQLRF